eukprot:Sspe_Gene.58014::Locus_31819_Transcript_3_3_Confidence_0.600_Length_554::g.58014::m.58014
MNRWALGKGGVGRSQVSFFSPPHLPSSISKVGVCVWGCVVSEGGVHVHEVMDTPEVSSTYSTPRRSARSDGSLARGDARLWESLGRQYQLVVQSLVSLDVPSEAKELLTQGLHKLGDLH